jgi:hypothetical protein
MKTAMKELLEWAKNSDMSDTMISPQDLLNVINPLLEKEKQQLEEARLKGYGEGYNEGIYDALNK